MGYLLGSLVAVIFPFLFKASNIEYIANGGVLFSSVDTNSYSVSTIKGFNKLEYSIYQLEVLNKNFGVRPDFFIDYWVHYGRLFIAPTVSFEPLNTSMQFKVKNVDSESSNSDTQVQFSYNKGPFVGIKLGYQLIKGDPLRGYMGSLDVMPYILAGTEEINYEDTSYISSASERSFKYVFGVGGVVRFIGGWSFYAQYKRLSLNSLGSLNITQAIDIDENELQIGMSYWFNKSKYISDNMKRKQSYQDIIDKVAEPVKFIYKDSNKNININIIKPSGGGSDNSMIVPFINKEANADSKRRAKSLKDSNNDLIEKANNAPTAVKNTIKSR